MANRKRQIATIEGISSDSRPVRQLNRTIHWTYDNTPNHRSQVLANYNLFEALQQGPRQAGDVAIHHNPNDHCTYFCDSLRPDQLSMLPDQAITTQGVLNGQIDKGNDPRSLLEKVRDRVGALSIVMATSEPLRLLTSSSFERSVMSGSILLVGTAAISALLVPVGYMLKADKDAAAMTNEITQVAATTKSEGICLPDHLNANHVRMSMGILPEQQSNHTDLLRDMLLDGSSYYGLVARNEESQPFLRLDPEETYGSVYTQMLKEDPDPTELWNNFLRQQVTDCAGLLSIASDAIGRHQAHSDLDHEIGSTSRTRHPGYDEEMSALAGNLLASISYCKNRQRSALIQEYGDAIFQLSNLQDGEQPALRGLAAICRVLSDVLRAAPVAVVTGDNMQQIRQLNDTIKRIHELLQQMHPVKQPIIELERIYRSIKYNKADVLLDLPEWDEICEQIDCAIKAVPAIELAADWPQNPA